MDIIQLINCPVKETVQRQHESNHGSRIKSLCPTRWTTRTGAMQAKINHYEVLKEKMEISPHGMDDCSRRANGMLLLMDKFSTYFGLELSVLIFSMNEQLSITLQAEETNVDGLFYGYRLVHLLT